MVAIPASLLSLLPHDRYRLPQDCRLQCWRQYPGSPAHRLHLSAHSVNPCNSGCVYASDLLFSAITGTKSTTRATNPIPTIQNDWIRGTPLQTQRSSSVGHQPPSLSSPEAPPLHQEPYQLSRPPALRHSLANTVSPMPTRHGGYPHLRFDLNPPGNPPHGTSANSPALALTACYDELHPDHQLTFLATTRLLAFNCYSPDMALTSRCD